MRIKIALWIVGVAVAVALIPTMPYGYYSIMRWVVFASCAWLALDSYRKDKESFAWCWGVIAGIYNPIIPVAANREIWSVVNIATIAFAIWFGFNSTRSGKGNGNGGET